VAKAVYNEQHIEKIREAGKVVAECLDLARRMLAPGATTRQVEQAIAEHIRKRGGTSPFFGYQLAGKRPFPCAICASVNDVVVHGISDDRPLQDGDLVSIDCGVRKDGFIADAAWSYAIGRADEKALALLRAGEDALNAGIAAARPRGKVGEISRAIERLIKERGYSVVREYVGHGVGRSLHEEPEVPNFLKAGALLPFFGTTLVPGTVICIEPMVNEGRKQVVSVAGEWPVRTADGGRSVHFEHTVAVRNERIEVLTKA